MRSERPRYRLALECLEARLVPSGLYQIGGQASVSEGSAYSLNLSTDQAVTQWQIVWGDGQSTTVNSNPSSVNHTFVDDGTYDISAVATDAQGSHTATVSGNPGLQQLVVNALVVPPTLNVSAVSTTLDASHVLTLNLAATEHGTDTIQSWTIYWGDGQSSTLPGTATTASHTYVQSGNYSIVADATDQDGTWPTLMLAVDSWHGRSLLLFDAATGTVLSSTPLPVPDPFGGPEGLTRGPDGDLYMTAHNVSGVFRFDGTTGAIPRVFRAAREWRTFHSRGRLDFRARRQPVCLR